MDDILVRIDRSSVNEGSSDLYCRLIDCKGEIEKLRAQLLELSVDAERWREYVRQTIWYGDQCLMPMWPRGGEVKALEVGGPGMDDLKKRSMDAAIDGAIKGKWALTTKEKA